MCECEWVGYIKKTLGCLGRRRAEEEDFPDPLYIRLWLGSTRTLEVDLGASQPLSPFTDDVAPCRFLTAQAEF
jgi:hypothetical protein